MHIPATNSKKNKKKHNPTPCHPPQSSNTCPWLREPSLTRGYPAARYAKSLWIPDTSARAGLRGDFQCSQTTVGLTGHFALDSEPIEGSQARGRSYLVKYRLIDSMSPICKTIFEEYQGWLYPERTDFFKCNHIK